MDIISQLLKTVKENMGEESSYMSMKNSQNLEYEKTYLSKIVITITCLKNIQ